MYINFGFAVLSFIFVNEGTILNNYTVMKVLLDIKDEKAFHLLEVLKSLPYVKTEQLTDEKAQLMSEIRQAVENLNLVREGKLKARPAKELLDEL